MAPAAGGSPEPPSLENLPTTVLKGVGPALELKLQRLGIATVQDLLFHLPYRYQDRTRVVPISTLRPGDEAVVEGEVVEARVKFGRRRMLLVFLADMSGGITLRFFHFTPSQQAALSPGTRLRCFGEARAGAAGLEIIHPEYRKSGVEPSPVAEYLTPIYPTTEGLQQTTLRRLMEQAVERLLRGERIVEWLPEELLRREGLPSLTHALLFLHRPPPDTSLASLMEGNHPLRQRLAFEELLAHHLSLRRLRARAKHLAAPPIRPKGTLSRTLLSGLPFSLTGAQQRVVGEILGDLAGERPMQRLVHGDVGSGKTLVAALAALACIEAGYQVAVMAPTEILAEQHALNFRRWLEPVGLKVGWLSGRSKGRARRATLEEMATGQVQLVVGTHALFQEGVEFHHLGLVVVDEQHRFGVHQRLALREKGVKEGLYPHQLIMTATPIPRTLAMTAYADLDVSVIDELPPGRTPVETVVVSDTRREEVIERVREACRSGRQAYWVCALVEESDLLDAQAAEATAQLLRESLPELRIGLVHGRLKPEEKESVMGAFKGGELDLLVATTVIEVGVDVPNASLMIIENAERFGLAQLHQLRGRVGRGATRSSCLLMYHAPLSAQSRQRLGVMRETNDGFVVAQKDLELRGPGELLGTRQTGLMHLRIADLQRDQGLMPLVARTAEALAGEPERTNALIRRWTGGNERYGEVF